MSEQAIVDRIEGSYAVLLIGRKKRSVYFPLQLMPKGTQKGTILLVEFDGKELVKVNIDSSKRV
jgi:hypothetical protein